MNTPQRPDWTRPITDRLDETVRQMDAATLARLNSARRAALRQANRRPANVLIWPAAGLLGAACAGFLAIGLWQGHSPANGNSGATAAHVNPSAQRGDDSDSADSIELYQDLDFYAWLGQQQTDDGE